MPPSDFSTGMEFQGGTKRYRCTDIGKRTVVAIRIDLVTVATVAKGKLSFKELEQC